MQKATRRMKEHGTILCRTSRGLKIHVLELTRRTAGAMGLIFVPIGLFVFLSWRGLNTRNEGLWRQVF